MVLKQVYLTKNTTNTCVTILKDFSLVEGQEKVGIGTKLENYPDDFEITVEITILKF